MRYRKVIYIGIVSTDENRVVGGFAVANARNIDEYISRGIQVEIINYPILKKRTLSAFIKYFFEWTLFLKKCISLAKKVKEEPKTLIHFTPLYKYFIYLEYMAIRIFYFYNKNILIDIRAGSFIKYYKNRGFAYRMFICHYLKLAKFITVEGEKYISFLTTDLNIKSNIHYYPNYVKDDQILLHEKDLIEDQVQIIYFGRITRDKGVNIIVKTHKLLCENRKVKTLIIGNIPDNNYEQELKGMIKNECIEIVEPKSKSEINKILLKSHFFIFPTYHTGEGHSNALTESMAYGVVPIVSNNGFNKHVVGNAGKVLDLDAEAKEYMTEIESILLNNSWNEYSEKSRNKILNVYSNKVVSDSFFKFINK